MRIVLGVPLDSQCEPGRVGDSNGLYRAVLRHALDDDAVPRFQNALTVERVDADRLPVEEPREDTAGNEADVMAVRENDFRVGMGIPVFQPGRPVVHASGQLPDFRMQGAPEGDSHLLDAAAQAQDGDAPCNAGLRHPQRHLVPVPVVGLVAWMGFGVEMDRMNVGPCARQQDAVDRVQQRPDIREIGGAPEHQGQGIGDFRHGAKVFLPDQLRGMSTVDEKSRSDDTDQWLGHGLTCSLPYLVCIRSRSARLDVASGHVNGSIVAGSRTRRRFVRPQVLLVQPWRDAYDLDMGEAIAFDTHRFVKRLTESGFTEKQAETLAEEHVALLNGNLATKVDLAAVKAELKRDIEARMTGNHASSAAATRKSAGVEAWLATNTDRGRGGADGGYTAAGTVSVAADAAGADRRDFTEAQLKAVVQSCWMAGGDPGVIMVGAFNKQKASGFAGIATLYRDTAGSRKPATIMGAADIYVSDFGEHRIVANRFSRDRTALVLDMAYWELAYLRPFRQEKLAKTGDSEKRHIVAELTLCAKNEAASGCVADLTTA